MEFGKLLPGDWVDEAKLLLFLKMEVTCRPPKKGKRLQEAKGKCRKRKKGKGVKRENNLRVS